MPVTIRMRIFIASPGGALPPWPPGKLRQSLTEEKSADHSYKSGGVLEVMLCSRSHGMVGHNHQPLEGEASKTYGRERRVSGVWIPVL
jgi:hypothetical protein